MADDWFVVVPGSLSSVVSHQSSVITQLLAQR